MLNAILILKLTMTKDFFKGMVFWFSGCAVAAILGVFLIKNIDLLMFGFASLFGVVGWLFSYILQIKKQEMEEINKKFEDKADKKEVIFLAEKIENFEKIQTEVRDTIKHIYNILINKK